MTNPTPLAHLFHRLHLDVEAGRVAYARDVADCAAASAINSARRATNAADAARVHRRAIAFRAFVQLCDCPALAPFLLPKIRACVLFVDRGWSWADCVRVAAEDIAYVCEDDAAEAA